MELSEFTNVTLMTAYWVNAFYTALLAKIRTELERHGAKNT
jgi:hypothetical protein